MNTIPDADMPQIIRGYEPGSGDEVKDQALRDISKMFGGLTPNY